MEASEQNKPRVVVIDSLQSWDFYVTQATTQNCPVRYSLFCQNWDLLIFFYRPGLGRVSQRGIWGLS